MTTTHPTDRTSPFPGAARAASYIEDDIDTAAVAAPSGPAAPAPEPESDPVDLTLSEPVEVEVEGPEVDLGTLAVTNESRFAQTGLRGALGRVGIKLAPSAAEVTAIAEAEQIRRNEDTVRQASWGRAVSILVANPKGGVGKTPVSLLLGGTLAAIRGGSVAVVEVSDDPGALTFRSEGAPSRGLGDLVRDADEIRSAGQLAGYTALQSSFAAVIGSTGPRPRLDGDHVTAVARVIDEYFAIRVMDSGNQPSSTAFQAAVEAADVLVVPILNAGDAALEAVAMLDGLRAAGDHAAGLANNAIVIRLHDGRPENPQVVARIDRILATNQLDHVHIVPYDAHIAERGQITLSKLAPATRHAIAAAASDVVTTLQNLAH